MKKFFKKHLLTFVILLVFLIGLSVLLYPIISDYFIAMSQSRVVATYRDAVDALDPMFIERLLTEAHEYNERLLGKTDRYNFTEEDYQEYYSLLNVDAGGIPVMGTLEVPLVNISLPIYHGTSDAVLQIGLGHFEGTSLPVGGPSTHSVITGHRGLPSALLLTDIDRMVIGDTFHINVLTETLTYVVDQILVILPVNFEPLEIEEGMDYVTLLTCTPYGINSHRLLVRGVRAESEEEILTVQRRAIMSEALRVDTGLVLVIILIPTILTMITVNTIKNIRKSMKTKKSR